MATGEYLLELNSNVSISVTRVSNIRFKVILTGDVDGTTDYEFPLKSYSGIHYSGKTSYLTFVLVYSAESMTAYNARPNGEIQLHRIIDIDGEEGSAIIAVGNPQSIDYYKGVTSSSLTIFATKQITNSDPKDYNLTNLVNITLTSDNEKVFEVAGFTDVTAGDSIIYEAETIPITQVNIMISTTTLKYKFKELI